MAIDVDSKTKLTFQNARNYTSEKVNELRDEINKEFATSDEFINAQVDLIKSQNAKLINETYDKLHREIESNSAYHTAQFDKMMKEEREIRAFKDTELMHSIANNKNMLIETINTKIESTQALARALVNEEAAERAKLSEALVSTFSRRMEALEALFKNLIISNIDQTRLQLEELIRNLDLKIENSQIWTLRQINSLVKDFDEYILSQTVARYKEEIYSKVCDKERFEQWCQVEDAFQVVGAKFDDFDAQRKEDVEKIDKKFDEIEKKNDQERLSLFTTMQNLNQGRQTEIEHVIQQLGYQGDSLQEFQSKLIQTQENLSTVDERLTNDIENVNIKFQVSTYVDFLYKIVEQNHEKSIEKEFKTDVQNKFRKLNESTKALTEKVEEIDEIQGSFEEKTETNFRIAEKALVANRDYINQIDARLTVEEMMVRVTNRSSVNLLDSEFSNISEQIGLVYNDIQKNLEKKFEEYHVELIEKVIEPNLEDAGKQIEELKQIIAQEDNKMKELYQRKTTEHEVKFMELANEIKLVQQNVSNYYKETAELTKTVLLSEIKKENQASNEVLQTELNLKIEELSKNLAQIKHQGISEETISEIKQGFWVELQENLENHINDTLENKIQASLIPALEKESNSYNSKLNYLDNQLNNIEEKLTQINAEGLDTTKKDIERLKELVKKLQSDFDEKNNTNFVIDKKINDLNSSMKDVEMTVKGEIDKTYHNQNENHKAISSQISNLSEQLKALQTNLKQQT